MKETFEKRRLSGKITLNLKDDSGQVVKTWSADKTDIAQQILAIVTDYAQQGYKLTLRQLYYQLVSKDAIPNHDTVYKKLGNIKDDLCYSGRLDWSMLEDRGRVPFLPYWVEGVPDAINDMVNQYRLDRQDGQDVLVELWTEKDALSGILRKVSSRYHVNLVVNKGYTSSTAIYDAYSRVVNQIGDSKDVKILYLGDHDPSGLDMVRDIRERLEFMLINGERLGIEDKEEAKDLVDQYLTVVHVGLTQAQIKQFNPPPNPAKITDPRAAKYIKKFGRVSWEVDAIKPQELERIVKENIENVIDLDKFDEVLEREKKEKAELKKFGQDYKNNQEEN